MNDRTHRKLTERLLLAPRADGDCLVLDDATLTAAIAGTYTLDAQQKAALRASPLTLRRFRHLSIRAQGWQGSAGMLRAASSGPLDLLHPLQTDDRHWSLHFLEQDGDWRLILALDPAAPFAARLLREQPLLRVVDGGGAIVLQGRLDGDGECESAWPFDTAPGPHLHMFGARFSVEPVGH